MDLTGLETRLKEMGSSEYSLKDFLGKIEFDLPGEIVPLLNLSIQSYQRNDEANEMGVLCKSGDNEIGLTFTVGESVGMFLGFAAKNSGGISFQSIAGFLSGEGLPSGFADKIKDSRLNEFGISFETGSREFSLMASGEMFRIPGQIMFYTFEDAGSQKFIFELRCSADPVLFTDLLEKDLGLDIEPGLKKLLPAFGFAPREFGFNQGEKSLVLRGVVQKPGSYEIECYAALSWDRKLGIDLKLFAEKTPPTLQSLSQDLCLSLDQIKEMAYIPEKVLNKIGATELHSLSLELDSDAQSLKLEGSVKLFGSLTALTAFTFKAKEFAFDASIYGEPLSLREFLDTIGFEIDAGLPDIKLLISEIHLSTEGEFNIKAGATFDAKGLLGLVLSGGVELTVRPSLGYLKLQCLSKSEASLIAGGEPLLLSAGLVFEMENRQVKQAVIEGDFQYQSIDFALRCDLPREGSGSETAQFKATAANVGLAVICDKILHTQLPEELPDLIINQLEFSIGSDKSVSLNGQVSLEELTGRKLKLHDLEAPLAALEFSFIKNATETKASFIVRGRDFPKFQELNMELKEYSFEFEYYQKQSETQGSWSIGGSLNVLAFDRLLFFKAAAEKNETAQLIDFVAAVEPALSQGFFSGIEGLDREALMLKLREKKIVDEKGILDSKLEINAIDLGEQFKAYIDQIKDVLNRVKKNNEPLITVPDLFELSVNKDICSLNPISLSIHFHREKGKPAEWKLSAATDFKLFDFFQKDQTILTVDKGEFSAFSEDEQKGFKFNAEGAWLYPLKLIPGLAESLPAVFGETASSKPKTDAFLNMFRLELGELKFIHDQTRGWLLKGALLMRLTDGLKTVHQDLYGILDRLFPTVAGERIISGAVSLSSKEGLAFEMTNNSGLEIPNLLKIVSDGIPQEYKNEIYQRFKGLGVELDIDNLSDIGAAFMLLEKFSITIQKEACFKITLAAGLPAKLNDFIFSKTSKLHGIIKTYDKGKLGNRKADQSPDDNLLRISLTIGTEGVSGQLENFDLIDKEKLKQAAGEFLAGCYEEKPDYVTFDLDGLVDGKIPEEEKDRKYGKVRFDKPRFGLDLKTGSFQASGGIHVESERLKIPVRPVIKKLLAFLPLEKYNLKSIANLADLLTDGIPVRTIEFFKDGKLNLSDLEGWLKELVHEDLRDQFQIPPAFKDAIEKEGGQLVNKLPQPFKDYLGIVLPKGFKFNILIPADQSFSFQLEVDQPGTGSQDLKNYLQLLIPVPSNPIYIYGLRLSKIGLGTALFNQFLRLDLSVEVDIFNTIHLAAGLVLPDKSGQTDERLKLLLPDRDKFCQHLEAKNLITLIILQTQIPIPVPLFFDRLYTGYHGLEGIETQLDIRFSAPQFSLMNIFKRFAGLINFFTKKDESLPVPSHALAKLEGGLPDDQDIIPVFKAGPFYVRLPGYLGYEIIEDVTRGAEIKQPVMLGFEKQIAVNFMDLVGTGANALKFSIYPLFDASVERKVPVKSAKDPSEIVARVSPLNYLIQYVPVDDRVGLKKIKLFYLIDIELAWALTTPKEFIETAYSKLIAKQEQVYQKQLPYPHTPEAMLAILPAGNEPVNYQKLPSEISEDTEGAVLFLKGAFDIGGVIGFDTALGLVVSEVSGVAAAISLRGYVANLLKVNLWGMVLISPTGKNDQFKLKGFSSFELMSRDIMKGSFEVAYNADYGAGIQFRGYLDLFPEDLFPDFPLRVYSGKKREKGQTLRPEEQEIVGLMNQRQFYFSGGIQFESGPLHLGGSLFIQAGKWEINGIQTDYNKFELELDLLGASLFLLAEQSNHQFKMAGFCAPVTLIPNLFIITAVTETQIEYNGKMITKGAQVLLEIDDNQINQFYFDGRVIFFGLDIYTKLHITKDGFHFKTGAEVRPDIKKNDIGYYLDCSFLIEPVIQIQGVGKAWVNLDLSINLGELGTLRLINFSLEPKLTLAMKQNKLMVTVSTDFYIKSGELPGVGPINLNLPITQEGPVLANLAGLIKSGIETGKELIGAIIGVFKDPKVWYEYAKKRIIKVDGDVDARLKQLFGVSPSDLIDTACIATNFVRDASYRNQPVMAAFNKADMLAGPVAQDIAQDMGNADQQLAFIRKLREDLLKEKRENPGKQNTMGEWYVNIYEKLSEPMVKLYRNQTELGKKFRYLLYEKNKDKKRTGYDLYLGMMRILTAADKGQKMDISVDFIGSVIDLIGYIIDLCDGQQSYEIIAKGMEALLDALTEYADDYQGKDYVTIRDKILPKQTPPSGNWEEAQ